MNRKHCRLFIDDDLDDRYLKGDNSPSFSMIFTIVVVLSSLVIYLSK